MRKLSRTAAVALFPCLFGLSLFSTSTYAKYDPARDYQEVPSIVKQFPAPSLDLGTPAFAADKKDFTSQDELTEFIAGLSKTSLNLRVTTIGKSQKGKDIPMLVFSQTQDVSAQQLIKNGKPTVLIVAMQHGDEPASGEGALAYAKSLAQGKEGDVLSWVNVLIVPRANPDGADAFTETLANGVDLNKDHLALSSPESRALASVMNEYQPDVVLDSREYQPAGRWLEKFGALARYDAMIQYATAPNLSIKVTTLSERTFRQSLINTLESNGLSHSGYLTLDGDGADKGLVNMGSIDANTFRSAAGLRNAVSLSFATRGVGLGKAHFARRVYTQYLSIQSLVKAAAKNHDDVIAQRRGVREEINAQAGQGAIVVRGKSLPSPMTLSMMDAKTADNVKVNVQVESALDVMPVLTRPRPYAYLLPPSEKASVARLKALGVDVYQVSEKQTIKAQQYALVPLSKSAQTIKAPEAARRLLSHLESVSLELAPGYYYVPLNQPLANLVVTLLEPDAPDSMLASGVMKTPASPKAQKGKKAKASAAKEASKDDSLRLPLYRVHERPDIASVAM
ncbi:M14 family metallocarboxypeptidase [Leminorella grimontii]|uniref:M14 family metallopeptidase n=1 Tax=Leminorella grimontii TaxID=82981 RepID=UPI0032208B77